MLLKDKNFIIKLTQSRLIWSRQAHRKINFTFQSIILNQSEKNKQTRVLKVAGKSASSTSQAERDAPNTRTATGRADAAVLTTASAISRRMPGGRVRSRRRCARTCFPRGFVGLGMKPSGCAIKCYGKNIDH